MKKTKLLALSLVSLLAFAACEKAQTPPDVRPSPDAVPSDALSPGNIEAEDTKVADGKDAPKAATTAPNGFTIVPSPHDFPGTASRVKAAIEKRGLILMATVDHSSNAKTIGQDLPPTTLFIFGNPKVGTQLMKLSRTAGADLPMKLMVWQDAEGKVSMGYNTLEYVAIRHNIEGVEPLITKVGEVLSGIASEATAP